MLESFLNDKSKFRIMVIFRIVIGMIFLGTAFYFVSMASDTLLENNRLASNYQSEKNWLAKFKPAKLNAIIASVPKPAKEQEVEDVQNKQLALLQKHHVTILNVRKDSVSKGAAPKKGSLPFVKADLQLQSSWDNLVAALNELEKKNLVVITDLQLDSKDGESVFTRMSYNIYYEQGKK
ncbi:MAG: hypothetical protein KBS60_01040 [Phascolarctobacterium sp.]|nr:hypothetical protein [Candidatus Phascolarctobacterium caballi]